MKTLLTVDFDFFVPEKPEWDFGHQESLIFLKMLWASRVGLMDKMRTTGQEKGFWKALKGTAGLPGHLTVSDSHLYAYPLSERADRVVLFDAHHDCWEGDSLGVDKTDHNVYCHNWLREWLRRGKRRTALWVKPTWQKSCDLPEDMKGRVVVKGWREGLDLGLGGSVGVHVCRSGCWVPPWLDKAFLGFLKAFGRPLDQAVVLQNGEWNPMVERWTKKDMEQVLAAHRQVQAKLKELRTGAMSSEDFLNAKVEQSLG